MPRELGLALFVLLGVVLLALMVFGWRRRGARQAKLGSARGRARRPWCEPRLVRRAVRGDDPRGPAPASASRAGLWASEPTARVLVADRGLVITLVGSDPFFIPKPDVTTARRASWTIDRGVEEDGLNVVAWTLAARAGSPPRSTATSACASPQAFDAAIAQLAPATEGTPS